MPTADSLCAHPALQFASSVPRLASRLDVELVRHAGTATAAAGTGGLLHAPAAEFVTHEAFLSYTHTAMRHTAAEISSSLRRLREHLEAAPPERRRRFEPTRPLVDVAAETRDPIAVDIELCKRITARNADKRKTPSMAHCYSALSAAQHAHYKALLNEHFATGRQPAATATHPQVASVIDVVAHERRVYLRRLQQELTRCPLQDYLRTHADPSTRQGLPATYDPNLYIVNHNFITPDVVAFSRKLVAAKRQRFRNLAEATTQSPRLVKGPSAAMLFDCLGGTGAQRDDSQRALTVVGLGPLLSKAHEGHPLLPAQVAVVRDFSPGHLLDLKALTPQPLPLPLPLPFSCSLDERERAAAIPGASPPVLVLSKGAFLSLCTQSTRRYDDSTTIPVRIEWREDCGGPAVMLGKPQRFTAPGTLSRKAANTAAFKRLVDGDAALPTRQRLSERTRGAFRVTIPGSSGGVSFILKCRVQWAADGAPVMRRVKMEYSSRGYNSVCDDAAEYRYEEFSHEEAQHLWLLFHAIPKLRVVLYRVNAFTACVIGMDELTKHTFTAMLAAMRQGDAGRLAQGLGSCEHLAGVCLGLTDWLNATATTHGAIAAPSTAHLLLHRPSGSSKIYIGTAESMYGTRRPAATATDPLAGPETAGEWPAFAELVADGCPIEPPSEAVAQREYLRPASWRARDRTPFTFPPREVVEARQKREDQSDAHEAPSLVFSVATFTDSEGKQAVVTSRK